MKTVLIDFSSLDAFCGFGEIARQYLRCLAKSDVDDMRFVLMVPEKHKGEYGDRFLYISAEHAAKELRALPCHIDLWHATDQQFKYRRRSKGTTQLLTVHDLNYFTEKKGIHLLKYCIRVPWRIRRSDYITVISHYVAQDVAAHYDVSQKHMEVIYNGIADVDSSERAGRRPAFVKDDDERFLFTIGQIREKKNFHTLVRMMAHLPEYKLYIAGDDHFKYAGQLRQLIKEQGEGRVSLVGKITDAEKNWLYGHCAAFVFPSRLEGFGIPVLEAMRFKAKVFSSRFSSLPEVCDRYATYWDSYEPQAMARVVSEGIAAWDKNGAFAEEARRYSLGFNYERYTREYIALYRRILEEMDSK